MPDKNVQLPDGRVVAFPDSMADADIAAVIQKQFPKKSNDFFHLPTEAPGVKPTADPLDEMFSATHELAPPVTEAGAASNIPSLLAMAASSAAGPEAGLLTRALLGVAGAGTGSAIKQKLQGRPVTAGETALDATVQGVLPEAVGAGGSYLASKLSPLASQSLARILRLSPKAFQFGREPAQEVLERGLASGDLKTMAANINDASKQVTSQLNDVLKQTPGTVNAENIALDVAKDLPASAGSRFLKAVDEAASKLGFRSNQMTSLSAAEMNALKREVANQGKFIEGDLRPSVGSAIKTFGGKAKDELVKLAPEAGDLLESSANLTEASKGANYAVRSEKAGQGGSAIAELGTSGKIGVHPTRVLTDRPIGPRLMFTLANALKEHTNTSNALRLALRIVFPSANEGEE